jgi:hypothetical protein
VIDGIAKGRVVVGRQVAHGSSLPAAAWLDATLFEHLGIVVEVGLDLLGDDAAIARARPGDREVDERQEDHEPRDAELHPRRYYPGLS